MKESRRKNESKLAVEKKLMVGAIGHRSDTMLKSMAEQRELSEFRKNVDELY